MNDLAKNVPFGLRNKDIFNEIGEETVGKEAPENSKISVKTKPLNIN